MNRLVKVPPTQNQFDALTSFTYNLGGGSLEHSTLLKLLSAEDYAGAADQFPLWDHAGGKASEGLLRRRERNAQCFWLRRKPRPLSQGFSTLRTSSALPNVPFGRRPS